jgi:RNA polymerase sigma-70 factor (ECF subfamily)
VLTDRIDSRYQGRSDASLLKEADRDPGAFSEVYWRHVAAVHSWLQRRLEWAASDLTAETFAQAWLHRDRFRDQRDGSALPWLMGIAGKLLIDALRRQRIETRARQRMGLPLDLASEAGYADVEARLSPALALSHALESLPEHELQALQLRVIDELPYDQVARRLKIRPAAARLRAWVENIDALRTELGDGTANDLLDEAQNVGPTLPSRTGVLYTAEKRRHV